MTNDATQNPTNRWARYSGAGTGGVTRVVPTEAEARRGLRPISIDEGRSGGRSLALALTFIVGAAVAGAAVLRARQPRSMPERIRARMGL